MDARPACLASIKETLSLITWQRSPARSILRFYLDSFPGESGKTYIGQRLSCSAQSQLHLLMSGLRLISILTTPAYPRGKTNSWRFRTSSRQISEVSLTGLHLHMRACIFTTLFYGSTRNSIELYDASRFVGCLGTGASIIIKTAQKHGLARFLTSLSCVHIDMVHMWANWRASCGSPTRAPSNVWVLTTLRDWRPAQKGIRLRPSNA